MPSVNGALLDLVNYLLPSPLTLAFFCLLVDRWRFSKRTTRWACVAFILLLLLMETALFFLIEDFFLRRLVMTLTACLPGLLFALLVTNYRGGQMLFLAFTSVSLLLTVNTLAEVFGSDDALQRLHIKTGVFALILPLLFFFFRPSLLKLLHDYRLSWYRLSLIPLLFCVLLITLLLPGKLYHYTELQILALVLSLVVFGSYIVIYRIFRALQDDYILRADNELLRAQVSALQTHADALQGTYDQLRIFRHDMRHYMQIQSTCLEHGDLEGAGRLLFSMWESLDRQSSGWSPQHYTGRPLIDAVLSNFAAQAEQEGVSLSIELPLPQVPPADPGELAVVLSNALENAFNACRKLPPGALRTVRVQGVHTEAQFLLAVSNTFNGDTEFDSETHLPVTHESGHGFGTQSIAAFAKRCGAVLDYRTEDGWFSLRLLF